MKIDLLTKVFPGKSSAGALGLSNSAMIRTNGHIMLFDTGSHGIIKILQKSLEEYQVSPNDVDMIFLSHMHYDHLNNVAYYPNAKIYIGKKEWEYAINSKDEWTPLESVEYLANRRDVTLIDDSDEILPGMHALWTPGHTPGHMSLVIDMPDGPIVLAGDAVKNRSELELGYSDQYVDHNASINSIGKIKAMAKRVLPGHDGFLSVKDGHVKPEEELTLDILLPKGCTAGDNGVYHLIAK